MLDEWTGHPLNHNRLSATSLAISYFARWSKPFTYDTFVLNRFSDKFYQLTLVSKVSMLADYKTHFYFTFRKKSRVADRYLLII